MAASEHYRRQVGLLIRVLPLVAQEQVFALKGGTAINLFIRDLPRLSVDIDLTYLPVAGRPESLADIGAAMKRIEVTLSRGAASMAPRERQFRRAWRRNSVLPRLSLCPSRICMPAS